MGTTSQKLTYLNTTKSKIKDSINLTGANITNNDTFRSYADKLKDSLLDVLNNGIDVIWNNFPKTTGTGTEITLNNTIQAPMKIDLKGNTSQESTTGKNLLQNTATTQTINGITFTINSDKSVKVSGTASATVYLAYNTFLLKAGTYTLSAGVFVNSLTRIQLIEDVTGRPLLASTQSSSLQTFTINEDKNVFLQYRINNGEIIDTTFYPQLESGSSATSYEPYTGGIASPNPDYPQEIKSVTGNQVISVCGKNLISSSTRSGNTLFFNNANSQTDYIFKAGTYTLSYVNSNTTSVYIRTATTSATSLGSGSPRTFTSNEDFNIWIYRSGMTDDETTNIQLEQGSTATTYQEYQTPQSQTIRLGNIELCKIPNTNYRDRLFKAIDGDSFYDTLDSTTKNSLDSGSWYKYGAIGKVVLDGSENWSIYGSGTPNYFYYFNANLSTADSSLGLSNYFQYRSVGSSDTVAGISINGNYIRIRSTAEDTTANFKTWLGTHNTIVYYVLSTPTFTKITDTNLISDLNNLYNLKSYNDTTNISVDGDLPMILDVSALIND